MVTDQSEGITVLLRAAAQGDQEAGDRVFTLLYDQLRSLARRQLHRQGRQTLNTTELVHEAYVKISGSPARDFADRGHFLCLAAGAMRHILVDHAREKLRLKRGGGARQETLDERHAVFFQHLDQVLAVDQALERLGREDSRLSGVVECKYFAGYTEPETAEALGVSERTVRRLWQQARTELRGELGR